MMDEKMNDFTIWLLIVIIWMLMPFGVVIGMKLSDKI